MWKPLAVWSVLVLAGMGLWLSRVGVEPRYGLPYVLVMLATAIFLFGLARLKRH